MSAEFHDFLPLAINDEAVKLLLTKFRWAFTAEKCSRHACQSGIPTVHKSCFDASHLIASIDFPSL